MTGQARSKGVEFDAQGELLPGWSAIATYTNQDVRITKSENGDVGQRFPNVPRNLASFWTTYEFQDETLKGWKIGGGVVYHGSQPAQDGFGTNLSPLLPMVPGYATASLMTAYSFKLADTKLTAQLNVTNLFDTTYFTDSAVLGASVATPGFAFGRYPYGDPRKVLGSILAQF